MTRRILARWGPVKPVLAAAGLAAALAGCATEPGRPPEAGLTTEAPNAIEVSLTHRSLAVHFEPGETAPRPKDVEAINVLLATGDIAAGDSVRIERAASVLADARARALAGALARQGLRPTIAASGGAPEGELRLSLEHATASVPRCPNWTKPTGNDFANTVHSDFGCAMAFDLAAMVVDPRDLVEGRPLAPMVGDPAIWPINRYRLGLPEKPEATSPQPWIGATTEMATAPPKPQAAGGNAERPPSGAAPEGAATAAASLPPGAASQLGYAAQVRP